MKRNRHWASFPTGMTNGTINSAFIFPMILPTRTARQEISTWSSLEKPNNRFLYAEERFDVVQRELELCGYSCIVTSEEMSASHVLVHYKGRDMSEKLFRTDKTFIGSKSMRSHSKETLSAQIFVEFIALIVRNRIYNQLKKTLLRLDSRPKYMSVLVALRELEKIEMVRRSNGQYRLDHAVSKKQKVILNAFGMNENDVRSTSTEISDLLKDDQSLLCSSKKEEDENGQDESIICD